MFERAVAQVLARAGFAKESRHGSRKDVGDVRWYFGIEPMPRPMSGEVGIFVEVGVFSEPLEAKSPRYRGMALNWMNSQIRVGLRDLAGLQPKHNRPNAWLLETDEEVAQAAKEAARFVGEFGLPFLAKLRSTDEMIPLLRDSRLTASSKARNNYDADAWEGKIDPEVQPWERKAEPAKLFTSIEDLVADLKAEYPGLDRREDR